MNENMVSWHFGISGCTVRWPTVGRTDAQIHADTVFQNRLIDAVREHKAATWLEKYGARLRLEEHHEHTR